MPRLVVLNGPPAVGKSTIARRYADGHPMALRIDVDELRDHLGAWRHDPAAAGLRARALAVAMADDHLRAGHDVVVAQMYGYAGHLDELAATARAAGAEHHEVVLMADRSTTLRRFEARGGPRLDEVLAAPGGLDAIAELHERIERLAGERDAALIVASIDGDPAATYAAVLAAIGA